MTNQGTTDDLRDALDRIANPILHMQREAPEGHQFDGRMARSLVTVEYLQGIARDAIDKDLPSAHLADYRSGKGLTKPGASRAGKEPCGECRLRPGETCDICDAREPGADAPTAKGSKEETDFRALAASLVDEINDLINESGGVWGLHLNGDDATWADITVGGRFERLPSLHDLRIALAAPAASAEV